MTEIGNFGQQPMAKSRSVRLILRSVITPARKHVEAISRAFDLDLAEAAVAGRVRGVVAQGVLGAQLFGDLVESCLQLRWPTFRGRQDRRHRRSWSPSSRTGAVALAPLSASAGR